jgi:glutathione S-transferase
MLTTYNNALSRSTRVLWLLEELGADYNIVPVTIVRADRPEDGPDARNPHPLKQVPCIEHDGEIIVESLAIWLHLTDLHPQASLAPPLGHPKRAEYMGWMGLNTCVFEPLAVAAMNGTPLTDRQIEARQWLDARFASALARAPYLLWDRFSTVDLVYASLLRFYPSALTAMPEIEAWLTRCTGRPAAARVRAKDAGG